jgi:hypothetical protein
MSEVAELLRDRPGRFLPTVHWQGEEDETVLYIPPGDRSLVTRGLNTPGLSVWDLQTRDRVFRLGQVRAEGVAVSGDGNWLAVADPTTVTVWDLATRECIRAC